MHKFIRNWSGAAAIAAWILIAGAAPVARAQGDGQPQKKYKDNGEYDAYSAVTKDIGASNFAKAITDLDTWKQKYPESDYKDDRTALYVQAYAGANQPAKAIDTSAELFSKDLNTAFPGPSGAPTVIRLLYNVSWAITQIPDPTPEEMDTGAKAAKALNGYDQKVQGATDAQWAQVRADMQQKAQAAILYIALLPGNKAYAKKDYAAAETAYAKALQDNPNNAAISYQLGLALRGEAPQHPEKFSQAVYQFQRAAVLDPTLGNPKNDPKQIQKYADDAYVRLHGGTDGLDQLKAMVKDSPMPPADFKIKTATEVAEEKQAEFEKTNPKLAMWMKIKAALADNSGEQYFASQLKDTAVPQLRGTLVDAKPACRPKTLLVAVPLPDAQQPLRAEITLKIQDAEGKDVTLTGKPELNTELLWEGVPAEFSKDPFMLTMNTPKDKITGLKTTPCAAAAPAKKTVSKKK